MHFIFESNNNKARATSWPCTPLSREYHYIKHTHTNTQTHQSTLSSAISRHYPFVRGRGQLRTWRQQAALLQSVAAWRQAQRPWGREPTGNVALHETSLPAHNEEHNRKGRCGNVKERWSLVLSSWKAQNEVRTRHHESTGRACWYDDYREKILYIKARWNGENLLAYHKDTTECTRITSYIVEAYFTIHDQVVKIGTKTGWNKV